MSKRRKQTGKILNKTLLYITVTFISMIFLIPIMFVVSLSFLSAREAYQYPLPLTPTLNNQYMAENSERGYLIYIYDKPSGEFESILDTGEMDKITSYFRTRLNTIVTEEEIIENLAPLETDDVVYFSERASLIQNYKTFFTVTRDAVPSLIRSLQIVALTIVISLSIGGLAGYAFARYDFLGKNTLKFSVLFVRMFPAVAIAMPMVLILANMGLYDKPLGLSLIYSIGNIGLTVWITASIFLGIPISLEEAAQVFGANKFKAFMRITLPLALPGLAAAAMYAFLGAWNETVSAIILTQFNPTFSVVVYQTLIGATGQINLAAAGSLAMALPAVIFTFIIRNYINQMWGGMTV